MHFFLIESNRIELNRYLIAECHQRLKRRNVFYLYFLLGFGFIRFDSTRFASLLLISIFCYYYWPSIHPSIHLACLPLIINCHRLLSSIHTRTPYATRQLWWRWPNHFMVWGYESSGGKEFLDTLLDPNDRQLRLGLLRIGISIPRAAINRVSMSFGGAT